MWTAWHTARSSARSAWPHRQPLACPDMALAVPVRNADVLAALMQRRIGCSAVASGWPMVLLRYAFVPEPGPAEPPPHLLASALTALRNCWICSGVVAPAAESSLVVPFRKRSGVAIAQYLRSCWLRSGVVAPAAESSLVVPIRKRSGVAIAQYLLAYCSWGARLASSWSFTKYAFGDAH